LKEFVSCAIKHLSVYHAYLHAIHNGNDKNAKTFCQSFFLMDTKQKNYTITGYVLKTVVQSELFDLIYRRVSFQILTLQN